MDVGCFSVSGENFVAVAKVEFFKPQKVIHVLEDTCRSVLPVGRSREVIVHNLVE